MLPVLPKQQLKHPNNLVSYHYQFRIVQSYTPFHYNLVGRENPSWKMRVVMIYDDEREKIGIFVSTCGSKVVK